MDELYKVHTRNITSKTSNILMGDNRNEEITDMSKATEQQIQRCVLDWLEAVHKEKGIYYFRSAAGMVKMESGRMFRTGRPGTPDISVVWQGHFIGLEIKTDKGRQSEVQKIAEKEIINAGGHYYIIRRIEDVWEIFK